MLLLVISWPVNNIHRLLNNSTPKIGTWYLFNDNKESLQWYLHDIFSSLSYLLIFISIWLYIQLPKRKDADINLIFKSFLIIQFIDFIHYIGWHRRSEIVLTIQGLILLFTLLRIFIKKHKNGQAG